MKKSAILRIEAIKFFKTQNILILLLIPVAAALLAKIYLIESGTGSSGVAFDGQSDVIKAFTNSFALVGMHYVAFSTVISTGREFITGILRKTLIDGYTRHEFIIARLCNLSINALLAAAVGGISLLAFLFSESTYNSVTIPVGVFSGVCSYVIVFFAYGILALFITILFKDQVRSLLVFTAYRIFEKLLISLDEQKWHVGYAEFIPTGVIDKVVGLTDISAVTLVLIFIYSGIALYASFSLMSKWEL